MTKSAIEYLLDMAGTLTREQNSHLAQQLSSLLSNRSVKDPVTVQDIQTLIEESK